MAGCAIQLSGLERIEPHPTVTSQEAGETREALIDKESKMYRKTGVFIIFSISHNIIVIQTILK